MPDLHLIDTRAGPALQRRLADDVDVVDVRAAQRVGAADIRAAQRVGAAAVRAAQRPHVREVASD